MNIKWTVENLFCAKEIDGYANVVVEVDWKCEASEGDLTKVRVGRIQLEQPNANFVPFEGLDELTVLNWCWNAIDKTSVETVVKSEIEETKTSPIQPAPLPWNF